MRKTYLTPEAAALELELKHAFLVGSDGVTPGDGGDGGGSSGGGTDIGGDPGGGGDWNDQDK